jgi:hypothetical protein
VSLASSAGIGPGFASGRTLRAAPAFYEAIHLGALTRRSCYVEGDVFRAREVALVGGALSSGNLARVWLWT